MANRSERRRLILLAEDNDDQRYMLRMWLANRGFDVVEASNGGEAVELCQRQVPDLILTDLQMPGIDGITAIKFIRRDVRLRDIPIIAVSAFGSWGMDLFLDIESFGDAPIEYIAKPLSFESLNEVLTKLLPRQMGA